MVDQPALVRVATPNDIEPLFWHLINQYGPLNTLPVPISPIAVLETVKACCSGNGSIAGVMESRTDGIIASVGLEAAVPWFSKQDIIRQIWLFVAPHVRSRRKLAGQLFQFAEWHREDMSRRVGYDMILENAVLSRDRLEAKTRLWRRHGEHIGSVFWTGGALTHEQDEQKHTDHDPGQPGGNGRLHRPR